MSPAKSKGKSSVNRQVKAAISAVRDFLAGRTSEAEVADTEDKATRQVVAEELLVAMSRGAGDEMSDKAEGKMSRSNGEKMAQELQHAQLEQDRARLLFLNHGYFEEAVEDLRAGESPAQRVAAARALGLVGSQRATAHLIAAMFDSDPEVRGAAEEALAQIGDSTEATPVNGGLNEQDDEISKLADALHSPETSPNAGGQDSRVSSKESQTVTKDQHAAAKSVTRDRSGRFLPANKATEPARAKSKAHEGERASENGPTSSKATSGNHVIQSSGVQVENEAAPEKLTAAEEQDQAVAETNAPVIVDDAAAAREVEQLLLEEHAVRETVEQLQGQLLETAAVRKESENQVRWRIERELKLRTDAAAQRREEEELRRQADAEAERLRLEEYAEAERRRLEENAEAERRRLEANAEAERHRLEANEETERRRSEESEAIATEQTARAEAEAEAYRLAEEEARMRIEAANLRIAAEELARHRAEIETARRETAQAARHAEAKRSRDDSEKRHNAQVDRLHAEEEQLRIALEETGLRRAEVEDAQKEAQAEIARLTEERAQLAAAEAARRAEADRMRAEAEERNRMDREQLAADMDALRRVNEELALRRAEVEEMREKADKDTERLLEAQARMRAAEEARDKAEIERLEVEAEIYQRVETEHRLLEEARRRAQEEQVKLEEEARRQAEAEQHRLAELEVARKKAELESKQRAEQEQQILSQINSLRIADAEARKRIEEAEVRRRTAEDAYRLVAEKVQRVETEAHASAAQEERMLAKLEAERRNVANEAQARSEQEKRIKEEIEMFRRLEDEERPRIEELTLQRTAAEARLQQVRDRLVAEEEARLRAEEQHQMVAQFQRTKPQEIVETVELTESDDNGEELSPVMLPVSEVLAELQEENSLTGVEPAPLPANPAALSDVPPAIALYLNSVDPYKRAAAVAELARAHTKDAFTLISDCFDDHSPHVRNAAARALRKLEPTRTVDLFNRALEGGSEERRRNIGGAIAASGLATEAIDNLVSENREDTYNALSILFVMAKTGEVEPLVQAIEEHRNDEVSRAVIKLLTLSGQSDLADAALKRRVNGR